MKVPVRWLSDYVETGLSPKELAHRMTMAGLEAEKLEEIGAQWDKIYVGYVTKVEKHPNADRLSLAEVEAGEHKLTVVTGAANIAQGQKVALALTGARLIDGHSDSGEYKTLKPAMMRGIKSEGMVCSEKELGLSDEHEGILELAPDAPVGVPLQQWLGETVIEFEITPNLVHAFSVLGIAREAAAITNKPLHQPVVADLASLPTAAADLVQIEDVELCPRYIGIVIEGIEVGPSPDWLAQRLTSAGMRPINNVVDVTNYVMHEIGQPLHAFDRDKLGEGRIVVRRARPSETLETLDHQQRQLTADMLVIADADKPVAMAGIMGGVDSEVSDATTTLLLEGANFNMKSVRRTARGLKLRTDASARFERGIDPNLAGPAMARATHLLLELCPNARVSAVADVYPQPVTPDTLSMRYSRIRQVLGIDVMPAQSVDVLTRLGFAPSILDQGEDRTLTVTVPTYRHDVSMPDDIVEEIARIIGYDTLPSTLPVGQTAPVRRDPMYRLQQAVRASLVASGASECVTYVTVSEEMVRPFADPATDRAGLVRPVAIDTMLRLRNPLQAERGLMRTTLVPSLLESLVNNLKHESGVRLFESARAYIPRGRDELPQEVDLIGIVFAGERAPVGLNSASGVLDFFDLKGALEAIWTAVGISNPEIGTTTHPALHPGRAAVYTVDGETLAVFGELRPDLAADAGIDASRVCVAEIDLGVALAAQPARPKEVTVPRYLPVQQDFAVVVPEATPAGDVEGALRAGAGPLATNIALFDIYRGPQIGEGNKSLAFRVTFTAPDRPLTDAELVKFRTRIEKVLKQRVNGTLRA
jgi:phenylalanyl-tRNA synthetase beta chain